MVSPKLWQSLILTPMLRLRLRLIPTPKPPSSTANKPVGRGSRGRQAEGSASCRTCDWWGASSWGVKPAVVTRRVRVVSYSYSTAPCEVKKPKSEGRKERCCALCSTLCLALLVSNLPGAAVGDRRDGRWLKGRWLLVYTLKVRIARVRVNGGASKPSIQRKADALGPSHSYAPIHRKHLVPHKQTSPNLGEERRG